jgi:hypothetical protein
MAIIPRKQLHIIVKQPDYKTRYGCSQGCSNENSGMAINIISDYINNTCARSSAG